MSQHSPEQFPRDPARIPLTMAEWLDVRETIEKRIRQEISKSVSNATELGHLVQHELEEIERDIALWESQINEIIAVPIEERIRDLGIDETPIEFFAIDGKGSRDRDDAIAIVDNGDGTITYHVAVSDVASVIAKDSPLDNRAMAQAVTRYHTSPPQNIFGTRLSEQYLSLASHPDASLNDLEVDFLHRDHTRPNLILVSSVTLDESGRVIKSEMSRSWGRIHRISKKAAGAWLSDKLQDNELKHQDDERALESQPIHMPDPKLYSIAGAMWLANLRTGLQHEGAIEVLDIEAGLITGEDGEQLQVSNGNATATLLIQEMMLQANQQTARIMKQAGIAYAFRNHGTTASYYDQGLKRTVHLDVTDPAEVEPLYARQKSGDVRNVKEVPRNATVSADMHFHMGLSMPYYAWWTSPIRRYADLINQRVTHYTLDVVDMLKKHVDEQAQDVFSDEIWRYETGADVVQLQVHAGTLFQICTKLPQEAPLREYLTQYMADNIWDMEGMMELVLPLPLCAALEERLPDSESADLKKKRREAYRTGQHKVGELMGWVARYFEEPASTLSGFREFLVERLGLNDTAAEIFIGELDTTIGAPPYTRGQIEHIAQVFNARNNKAKAKQAAHDQEGQSPYDADLSLILNAFPDTDRQLLEDPKTYPYKASGFSKLLQAALHGVGDAAYNDVIGQEFERRLYPDVQTAEQYPLGKLHPRDFFMILTYEDHTDHQQWQRLKIMAMDFLRDTENNHELLEAILAQFDMPLERALPLHYALPRDYHMQPFAHIDMRQRKIISGNPPRSLEAAIVVYQRDETDAFTVSSNEFSIGESKQNVRRQAMLSFLEGMAEGRHEELDERPIPPELWDGQVKHLQQAVAGELFASEERLLHHVHHLLAMLLSDLEHIPATEADIQQIYEDDIVPVTQREIIESLLDAICVGKYFDGPPEWSSLDDAMDNQQPRTLYKKLSNWLNKEYIPKYIQPIRDMRQVIDYEQEAEAIAEHIGYNYHVVKNRHADKTHEITIYYRPLITSQDAPLPIAEVITVRDDSEPRAMREAYKQLVNALCAAGGDVCVEIDTRLPRLATRMWQDEMAHIDNKPQIIPR